MRLTEHFTLEEMTFSSTASRLGLPNQPRPGQIARLTTLCEEVLEPLRTLVGKPIFVTSGYRSESVNRAVGGSTNSQHLRGEAADIRVEGMTTQEFFDVILNSGIPFDQIIQELDSWVHISYRRNRLRRSVLYAVRNRDGKIVYLRNKPAPPA